MTIVDVVLKTLADKVPVDKKRRFNVLYATFPAKLKPFNKSSELLKLKTP